MREWEEFSPVAGWSAEAAKGRVVARRGRRRHRLQPGVQWCEGESERDYWCGCGKKGAECE